MTGVVTEIRDDDGVPMALIDTGDATAVPACLITCEKADVGDSVLVHSGYVLKILEEDPS